MRTSSALLLFLLLLIASCQEVIQIDLPEGESRVVVQSNFNPDSLFKVQLSQSQAILSEDSTNFITNADVSIEIDRITKTLSPVFSNGGFSGHPYFVGDFKPRAGQQYTLVIKLDNQPEIRAISNVPKVVGINKTVIDSVVTEPSIFDRFITYYTFYGYCEIDDPSGAENYYQLAEAKTTIDWYSLHAGDTTFYRNRDSMMAPVNLNNSQDPAFLALVQESGFLINDATFDGQTKRLPFRYTLLLNDNFQLVNRIEMRLRSVSREYYLFHSSFTKHLKAISSTFSEPVLVYNNIINGQGNFSGYSTAVDSVNVGR